MISANDIDFYVRQTIRFKNNPQTFANCELAPAVYEGVKEKYPNAVIYDDGQIAYICLTKCAKRKLLKRYLIRRAEQEKKLECINQIIDRIKEEEKWKDLY